ncbi:MAG: hypothetical protein H7834_12575 [Magnetococcus sp. YQC-9]
MDAKNDFRTPHLWFASALCAGLVAVWSAPSQAGSATVDKTGIKKAEKRPTSDSAHIYYPDTARPFYDYQETGAFVGRPMVIPPTLPIITQPAYLVVQMPPPEVVQAPLPTLAPQPAAPAPLPATDAASGFTPRSEPIHRDPPIRPTPVVKD